MNERERALEAAPAREVPMTVTIDQARADRLCVAAGVLSAMRPSLQPDIDVALAALLVGQEPPPEARLAAQLLRGWLPLRLR